MLDFEKVAEVRHGPIVVEIMRKNAVPKHYFDVVCKFEALGRNEDGRFTSLYIPIKYSPDLIAALVRSMEFISEQHRGDRDGYSPQTTSGVVSSWEDAEELTTGLDCRLVREVKCGVAVTGLFEDPSGFKYLKCEREYSQGGSWARSTQLQQRNLRDLVISVAEIWSFLENDQEQ